MIQSKLAQELHNAFGIACAVHLVGRQEIQRSEGKAIGVIDSRS